MNLFVLYVFYICLCCQTSTISIAIYFTNHIFDEYIFEIFYDRKFCFCNFLQPNVFPFQQMMLNRFRSLVVVALGCLQKTSACKLPQHKTVINQIKQRDGRWKVEGGRETACKQQVKDVGKTEGGGERRGEKRTGNVEISSGCEVCVRSWQALALSRSVCVSCRRNRRTLSYMRLQRRTELEKFVSSFFFSLWCRVFSQRSVFLTTLKKRLFWLGGNLVVVLVFGSEVLLGGHQRSRCHVSSHPFTRGTAASAVSQSHLWASRVSGLCWGSWRFSAMLRCVIQRANSLTHSHPLASVTFRGKRLIPGSDSKSKMVNCSVISFVRTV